MKFGRCTDGLKVVSEEKEGVSSKKKAKCMEVPGGGVCSGAQFLDIPGLQGKYVCMELNINILKLYTEMLFKAIGMNDIA